MNNPTRVAVLGASGRMGQALVTGIAGDSALELVAALSRSDDPYLGDDAMSHAGCTGSGVAITADFPSATASCDVVIDFSSPEATLEMLELCVQSTTPLVIGTTGFSAAQCAMITNAARRIPICKAANFSIGVNVCLRLIGEAARALGSSYDIEIVEAHHRYKVDAPSGTALAMGGAVANALGWELDSVAVYGRGGQTGARAPRAIGFSAVRGGDVVGDHTVLFLGEGERVEITHRPNSRLNFARGALRAATWLIGRPARLYDMQDVLALK